MRVWWCAEKGDELYHWMCTLRGNTLVMPSEKSCKVDHFLDGRFFALWTPVSSIESLPHLGAVVCISLKFRLELDLNWPFSMVVFLTEHGMWYRSYCGCVMYTTPSGCHVGLWRVGSYGTVKPWLRLLSLMAASVNKAFWRQRLTEATGKPV